MATTKLYRTWFFKEMIQDETRMGLKSAKLNVISLGQETRWAFKKKYLFSTSHNPKIWRRV